MQSRFYFIFYSGMRWKGECIGEGVIFLPVSEKLRYKCGHVCIFHLGKFEVCQKLNYLGDFMAIFVRKPLFKQ